MTENAPIARDDPLRVVAKKLIKKVMSTQPGLATAYAAIRLMERLSPEAPMLRRAYWSMCGVHIFKGVRDGLRMNLPLDDAGRPGPSPS